MNPGKLNHRIKFYQEQYAADAYGGQLVSLVPFNISQTVPYSVTWASMEPIKQWNQMAIAAGGTVMSEDRVTIIRYRALFAPNPSAFLKGMVFEDLNYPGSFYTIHSVLPYQPGSKSTFQNTDQQVYKDNVYVFMLAKKRS